MRRTKDQHFAALAETSAAVMPVIDAMVYADMDDSLRVSIGPDMEMCLSRRRAGPLLRPLLARIAYDLSGGSDWREQVGMFAAVELLNISTYQSNYCFDEKAGVSSAGQKNNQFICSMLTISKAISGIEASGTLSGTAKSSIATLLSRSNHEVYLGQFQDLNVLNLDVVDNFPELEGFIPVYLKRCDLIAGSTFRSCAAGAMANDPPSEVLDALLAYLSALGCSAQVVNDLGDYVPHVTKDYAVPFSDFQLGRLTLPTFILYQAGLPLFQWREELREKGSVPSIETALVNAIKDLKIESRVRELVKKHYFPRIKSSLARLEAACGADSIAPLKFAYPYIYESRLMRFFRKDADRARFT